MKTQKSFIKNLLDKTLLSETEAAILDFSPNGIKIAQFTKDQILAVFATLNSDVINDYKPIGEIAIKDLRQFQSFVDRIESEINFTVSKDMIILKGGNKEIEVTLADKEFVQRIPLEDLNIIFEDVTKSGKKFELELKHLKEFSQDMGVLKESQVFFRGSKDGNLTVEVQLGTNKITTTIPIKSIDEDFEFGMQDDKFKELVKCLSAQKIECYFKEMKPAVFIERVTPIIAKFLVAPLLSDKQVAKDAGSESAEGEE